MKNVVYIHGLNSSCLSFKYAQYKLPDHNVIPINYDSHQPLAQSIEDVLKKLPKGQPLTLVGHSLGGVIATLLADRNPDTIENLITISSPHGGSRAAGFVRWIPGHPLVMADLTPTSKHIAHIGTLNLEVPTLNIISVGGHLSSSPEPNDSVITVRSQKALNFGKKIEVKANHFEVLMHDKMINHVRKHVFGDTQ